MHLIAVFLAFLAAPFWEAKPPREWTMEELQLMLHDSPWAQEAGTQVYLATARPIEEAEAELKRRTQKSPGPESPLDEEYRFFMRENPGKYIVLAVLLPRPEALADADESKRMEEESLLKVGKKKYKLAGHFPPTSTDPYLRLLFPREVSAKEKHLTFELYLPSVPKPYRFVEFDVKDMFYKGKLEL